jgi:hypothetical protein
MEALYGLLGLVVGVAIAEAVHWRRKSGRGIRSSPAARSTQAAGYSCRFTAQDYYDR